MPGRPFFELLLLLQYATWGDNPRLFHWAGAQLAGVLFICLCAPFQAVQWISAPVYL